MCIGFQVMKVPRGAFSTDRSHIGQGTPALVVARDINYLAGADVMDLINTVRPEYEGRVAFLAAHLRHPDGQTFARRQDMKDAIVIIFDTDGSPTARVVIPQTADELCAALDTVEPLKQRGQAHSGNDDNSGRIGRDPPRRALAGG